MPSLLKRLSSVLYLRTLSRDLARVATALEQQSLLLARLADRYAPIDPPTERAEVKADTGVTFHDAFDEALAESYRLRTLHDTGRLPDDEEVLLYLGDEKTTDLRARLIERDQELERLQESRQ